MRLRTPNSDSFSLARSHRGAVRWGTRAALLVYALAMGWGTGCGTGPECRALSAEGDCSCLASHSPNEVACTENSVIDGSGVCCASPGWPTQGTCNCVSVDYITKYRQGAPPCSYFGPGHTAVQVCSQSPDMSMPSGSSTTKPAPRPKPQCTSNSDCTGCQRCASGTCQACSIGALGRCSC
jgi:hypothetical protein